MTRVGRSFTARKHVGRDGTRDSLPVRPRSLTLRCERTRRRAPIAPESGVPRTIVSDCIKLGDLAARSNAATAQL